MTDPGWCTADWRPDRPEDVPLNPERCGFWRGGDQT